MSGSQTPRNTAFLQQRLKAWLLILTPKVAISVLLSVGCLLSFVGIVLVQTIHPDEILLDYTTCQSDKQDVLIDKSFSKINSMCTLRFRISKPIKAPVYLYYMLENYYQNYRFYAKSFSAEQLAGKALDYQDLESCYPIIGPDGESGPDRPVFYPCGLVANSYFQDLIHLNLTNSNGQVYTFTSRGIGRATDKSSFLNTSYPLDKIRVPPAWQKFYGSDRYTAQTLPVLNVDEHFQNWMRFASFPCFRKLYGKNVRDDLASGEYTMTIIDRMNVSSLGARKLIIISSATWLGDSSAFLSTLYILMGILYLVTAITLVVWHFLAPRQAGDYTYLSWNELSSMPATHGRRVLDFLVSKRPS